MKLAIILKPLEILIQLKKISKVYKFNLNLHKISLSKNFNSQWFSLKQTIKINLCKYLKSFFQDNIKTFSLELELN